MQDSRYIPDEQPARLTALAHDLDELVASRDLYGWQEARGKWLRRGFDVCLHQPGCYQYLSADGAREFVANVRWLKS